MATAVDSVLSGIVILDECKTPLDDIERIAKERFPDCADHQIHLRREWTVTKHRNFLLFKEEKCQVTRVYLTHRSVASAAITLYAVKTAAKDIPGCEGGDFKGVHLKFWNDGSVEINAPVRNR
jgi:hypothetical protein